MSGRGRSDDGEVRSVEEPCGAVVEDTVFVAVGNEFKKSKSTILWALQNSGGRKLCILHIHLPAQSIPVLGGRFPINQARDAEVKAYREQERIKMFKVLDEYSRLCSRAGVVAQKLYTAESDSIETGIVTLISQKKIGRLVMGAAGDGRYSRRMVELKSKKAIHVCNMAPGFCHIFFVCKGRLIYTRQITNLPKQVNDEEDSIARSFLRNAADFDRWSSSRTSLDCEESFDDCDRVSRSVSESIGHSSSPSSSTADREMELQLHLESSHSVCNLLERTTSCIVLERRTNDQFYDQLIQATEGVDNLRRQSFSEYISATQLDKNSTEAVRKAKALEVCYFDELMKMKKTEADLVKKKKELEMAKAHNDRLLEELRVTLSRKNSLENDIEKLDLKDEGLEPEVTSPSNILQKYKKGKDDQPVVKGNNNASCVTEFSFLEIADATDNFNPSMEVGEGGYGSIYRAFLRHTEVAIKILKPSSLQGLQEFQQEVNVLSKLRHPNIVTLIGICEKASAIVYEYVPNGNLEDRLSCKGNTPPLSWKQRIRIATEICSALVFLHSNKPHSIIHGDLKPSNILLDAQSSCKLSDFGMSHAISDGDFMVEASATRFCLTQPKGTFCYMDPELLATGELTLKSDIYSYGIVLMQLLTGKQALRIRKEVEDALQNNKLDEILDPLLAGEWLYDEAKRLACVALRCSDTSRKNRPDHIGEVWKVIESVKGSLDLPQSVVHEERKRIVPYRDGKRGAKDRISDYHNWKPTFLFRNGIL